MRDTYLIRPNEARPDWPPAPRPEDFKRKDDMARALSEHARAVEAAQRRVPYYGHAQDDNLDWREMVHDVKASVEAESALADGRLDRTLCWTDPADLARVRGGETVTVQPRVRYGAYDPGSWEPNRCRYAYVTWEVVP